MAVPAVDPVLPACRSDLTAPLAAARGAAQRSRGRRGIHDTFGAPFQPGKGWLAASAAAAGSAADGHAAPRVQDAPSAARPCMAIGLKTPGKPADHATHARFPAARVMRRTPGRTPAGRGERCHSGLSWVGGWTLCAGGSGLHLWPVNVGATSAVTSTGGDNPQPYVRIRCPYCRRKYRVPPHRVGSGVRCAECGMPFQLGIVPGAVDKPTLRPGYVLPPATASSRDEPAAKPPSPASPLGGEASPGSAWHGVPSSLPVEPASPAGDSLGSPPRPSPLQGTAETGDGAATSPDAAQAPVTGQHAETDTPSTLPRRSLEQEQTPEGPSQPQVAGEDISTPVTREVAPADPSPRAASDVAAEPVESSDHAAAAPVDSAEPVEAAGPGTPAEPAERAGEGSTAEPPPRPPKVRPQIIHIPKAHRPEMARPSPGRDGAGSHAAADVSDRRPEGDPHTGRARQPTNISPIDTVIAAHSRPMPRGELEELERELEMMRARQGNQSPDEKPGGSAASLSDEAEPVSESPSDQVLQPGSGMAGQDGIPEPLRSKLAANPPAPDPTPPETPDSSDITYWRRALEQAHASDLQDEGSGEHGEADSPKGGGADHRQGMSDEERANVATGPGSGGAGYPEAHRPSSAPPGGKLE